MAEILLGRNAVRECLRARRRHIHKLYLVRDIKPTALVKEVMTQATALNIPKQKVSRANLDKFGSGHQGMALEVGRLPASSLNDILNIAQKSGEPPFLLVLDHLEDPQNVGALLRTAEAVAVHGVVLPDRRAVGITPGVVKASAGASEYLQIVTVTNLVQALKSLKQAGVWIIGLEKTAAAEPFHQVDLNMPLALVLGSEGKGLSRLVAQTCDLILEIPMQGHIESLNVSVSGALALYEAWRARQ